MTLPPSTPAVLRDRTQWHLGANAPVVAWLAALLAITLTHSYVAESPWLMVHLLLLGAVTNAIFVWSSHFADALLRRRATAGSRRWQTVRMVTLNLGVLMVVAGMVSAAWVLTLVGSVIVGTAAAARASRWSNRSGRRSRRVSTQPCATTSSPRCPCRSAPGWAQPWPSTHPTRGTGG